MRELIILLILSILLSPCLAEDINIISGTKYEFDNIGEYNSLVQIDSTHFLNVYRGESNNGTAVVLTVNQTDWTITSGTKHIIDMDMENSLLLL